MSTSYFRLLPGTQKLVRGLAKIGVPNEHLRRFALEEPDNKCPLRSYWGGSEKGSIVYTNENDLSDDMLVISSYGELLTVAQVKARHGAKRKDNMPTELFGYEKEEK